MNHEAHVDYCPLDSKLPPAGKRTVLLRTMLPRDLPRYNSSFIY